MIGDVSLSAEDKPPPPAWPLAIDQAQRLPPPAHYDGEENDDLDPEEHEPVIVEHHSALKFLFAGG